MKTLGVALVVAGVAISAISATALITGLATVSSGTAGDPEAVVRSLTPETPERGPSAPAGDALPDAAETDRPAPGSSDAVGTATTVPPASADPTPGDPARDPSGDPSGEPPPADPADRPGDSDTDTLGVDEAELKADDASPTPQVTPVRISIPKLAVEAEIVALGVADSGQMDVPDNTTDVGWYRHGPSPGQDGSAVLAAHVDLAGRGPGVFYDLSTMDPGDRFSITFEDGTESGYRVVAGATYDKSSLPLDAIFSRRGPAVVTLITCGGGFSASSRSYDSNVVVYAVPVAGAPSVPGAPG